MNSLKQQLYAHCLQFVHERIAVAQDAIQAAQLSANEETKSSAGDKYETGRAMAQLEIENKSSQLAESLKLKQVLEQIFTGGESEIIRLGSVVITNQLNFYIAISAGPLTVNGQSYVAISAASPIGQKLMGLRAGTSFNFNKRKYLISQVL